MDILYQDNHLLVVVKPPNMPVQADESGDLDNGLKFIGVSVNPNMFITTGPSLLWMFKPIEELFKDIQGEEDLLSRIKDYLTGADKFGGNDEAGLMGDLIDYFQNLAGFFLGDKKGWTGAGDLCDLATGSVKLWTGMYDYFQNMYDGLTTGFFGRVTSTPMCPSFHRPYCHVSCEWSSKKCS